MTSYLKPYITHFMYISLTLAIIPNAYSENYGPSYKKSTDSTPKSNSINKALDQPIYIVKTDGSENKNPSITATLPFNGNVKYETRSNLASGSIKIECKSESMELCGKFLNNNSSGNLSGKDILVISISLLALFTSVLGLVYNHWKDNKSRLRSINDDFWIRKIISPVTIEPLVKEILDVVANLPDDCGNDTMLPEIYQQFTQKYHPKIQQLSSNFQALKLLDSSIYASSAEALSSIEDIVLEYCGSNSKKVINLKTDTSEKIIEIMLSILSSFKAYQTQEV